MPVKGATTWPHSSELNECQDEHPPEDRNGPTLFHTFGAGGVVCTGRTIRYSGTS